MTRGLCVFLLGVLTAAAGCGSSGESCATTADCLSGFACATSGDCIPAEDLRILNESLPEGSVGVDYQVTLTASGGIPPYSWTLSDGPLWLGLGADSGILSGLPDLPGSGLGVGVTLRDSSAGGGQAVDKQFLLSIIVCVDGRTRVCLEVEAGKCMEGLQTCSDGQWGACVAKVHSEDFGHCGPSCGACNAVSADRCDRGECRCGVEGDCLDGDICCQQTCVDPSSDDFNCGSCGTDCAAEVQNATGADCFNGVCIFAACDPDHLDCNGDTGDGCETPQGLNQCGACGTDCAQTVQNAIGVGCREVGGRFGCQYDTCVLGYLDCDGLAANGCSRPVSVTDCGACSSACGQEQDRACVLDLSGDFYHCGCATEADCAAGQQCCDGRCYEPDDPGHCGDCDSDCLAGQGTPVCLDPDTHLCGCSQAADCGAGSLCCGQVCVPIGPLHCGACDLDCTATPTDQACLFDAQLGAHRCGCRTLADCDSDQQCCPQGSGTCFAAADPRHCGGCGVNCLSDPRGPICLDPATGTCGCTTRADCGAHQLCCANQCIPVDNRNCGSCNYDCRPIRGGPLCDLNSEQCYCGADEQCQVNIGSAHTCEGIGLNARCACGSAPFCTAGLFERVDCCETSPGQPECVSIDADSDHCGRCGVQCNGNPQLNCSFGACGCAPGVNGFPGIPCPADSPASYCTGFNCRCTSAGYNSCFGGEYCCDGTAGGQGGPGNGPDVGCCENLCGTNTTGECDYN